MQDNSSNRIFNDEQIAQFYQFANILRRIHKRGCATSSPLNKAVPQEQVSDVSSQEADENVKMITP